MSFRWKYGLPLLLGISTMYLESCTKEIDVGLPPFDAQIQMEGYVNDTLPLFNYIVLNRSVDYFDPNLSAIGVPGAQVTVEEGERVDGGDTVWGRRWELQEAPLDELLPDDDSLQAAANTLPTFYIDPSLSWIGKPGKLYRATVIKDADTLVAVTRIPAQEVALDSLTYELELTNDTLRGLVKYHFQEPPTQGNYYRVQAIKALRLDPFNPGPGQFFGWGNFTIDFVVSDESVNGEYRSLTTPLEIAVDDSITAFLNHIDRASYEYWESFFNARDNGGPFAQPIQLKSNVRGGLGVFTGINASFIDTVVQKP